MFRTGGTSPIGSSLKGGDGRRVGADRLVAFGVRWLGVEIHAAREVLCTDGLDRELGRSPADSRLLHARARLWLAEGDFERAHADARELGERAACQGRPNPTWGGWRSIASLALAHLGRRREAAALADAEVELARQFGAPVAVARGLPRGLAWASVEALGLQSSEGLGPALDSLRWASAKWRTSPRSR